MNKDVVVLIPVYDPDVHIMENFDNKLKKKFSNIVFVDDGCNPEYDDFWNKLKKDYPVVVHTINYGKGRGIKNGLNYIIENYPDVKCIVTADCDGQHAVEDIEKCAKASLENQNALILGVRDFDQKDVPKKSMLGNKITRNILKLFLGIKVSDTQTGLRAMSREVALDLIQEVGERYEYETNVLMATKSKNIAIEEVGIQTIYIEDNRTSHYHPVKDSVRIYKLFSKIFLICFTAFIFECILFSWLMDLIALESKATIILSIMCAKLIVNFYILVFNKHVEVLKVIVELLVTSLVLCLIPKGISLLLVKVIMDILLLLIFMLLTRIRHVRK